MTQYSESLWRRARELDNDLCIQSVKYFKKQYFIVNDHWLRQYLMVFLRTGYNQPRPQRENKQ